ncbi:MAG TPA: hypothetical protein VIL85_22570 [Thermomicrobiales bacterium]
MDVDKAEAEKRRIADALEQHGVSDECPACGGRGFALAGYSTMPIQSRPGIGRITSGSGFPVVVTICHQCGYTRSHALRPLGLPEE